MLKRLARRVDAFSADCEECQKYRSDVRQLLGYLKQVPSLSETNARTYVSKGNVIGDHLQKEHRLILKWRNLNTGLLIGFGATAILNFAFRNIVLGFTIGIVIGLVTGSLLEYKARKEDRII
jgi:hypothetical protein